MTAKFPNQNKNQSQHFKSPRLTQILIPLTYSFLFALEMINLISSPNIRQKEMVG